VLKREKLQIAQIYVPAKKKGTLNPDVVREIAESILEIGQQEPIQVRPDGDRYVLVEGLHRLEACRALGEDTIVGFLVQARPESAISHHETEAQALRQKMDRLRQLRLAKEATERKSTAAAEPVEEPTPRDTKQRPSRTGNRASRSKPSTLLEWLADREHNGLRN
jgi:uncharacterized ParB-like nuclease family protein